MNYFFTVPQDIPLGIGVQIFSRTHLLWLGLILLLCVACIRVFRTSGAKVRSSFLRLCAILLLTLEVARTIFLIINRAFDPAWALPLHLCGAMVFVEFFAVYTRRPFLLELSYCLGMPGALFALITPGETSLPLFNACYIQFILAHTLLFLIPILMLIDGFCPSVRRLPACFGALLWLATVASFFNRLYDGNYLFLEIAPAGSFLEILQIAFGRFYIVAAVLSVWGIWIILYLPWSLHHAAKKMLTQN